MAVLALVLGLFLAAPAFARPGNAQKVEDIARILRAKADPTPADLARAGEDADGVLVDLLSGRKIDVEVRRKAARALGRYPGERTSRVLSGVVFNKDEPSDLRALCMGALAHVRGAPVVEDLRPFLSDGDPVLRAGAGRAIGVTRDPRGCSLLADAVEHEEVLEVRGAMEEGLRACATRGEP
jgi:HEAT repeat protein